MRIIHNGLSSQLLFRLELRRWSELKLAGQTHADAGDFGW
jgi:hypothetical protein